MALPSAWLEASAPGRLDIIIVRGRTFQRTWQLRHGVTRDLAAATPLTGCTCSAQVRTLGADALLLDLGGAVTDPANGYIKLYVSPSASAALAMPGNARPDKRPYLIGPWDLRLSDGTDTVMPLCGNAYLQWNETP